MPGGGGQREKGRWGEQAAADWLKKHGWRIRAKNFSCRFGEVDIVAENREYLAFVEVKLRKDAAFAEAKEFVSYAKQRRLISTAQYWLALRPTEKQPRFDVVEIYGRKGAVASINHIENAYTL